MKTLVTMFAAVVITTTAFANGTRTATSYAAQSGSTINNTASTLGSGKNYSDKTSRRVARRHIKLLSGNPFRIVSLKRGSRY